MPELPEVETVRIGLQTLLPGLLVKSVETDSPKSFPNDPSEVSSFLIGARISEVRRRAKVLLIDLTSGYTLVCHLKMTGQMVFVGKERFGAGHPNDGLIDSLPNRATRVTLEFTNGSKLYFNDQRKFGWMKFVESSKVELLKFFMTVGPEPLTDEFTAQVFINQLKRRSKTTIKAALLDQTVLAGVGNIYADESLWGAKIHPATKVADVPLSKLKTLYEELQFVLRLAIEKGGSTDRNYVNAEGKKGSYMSFARVFRREGQDCPRHPGVLIIKTRVAGRGTHTCPKCQKA